jgi:hypothetical protein
MSPLPVYLITYWSKHCRLFPGSITPVAHLRRAQASVYSQNDVIIVRNIGAFLIIIVAANFIKHSST